jgi:hypothetical protein
LLHYWRILKKCTAVFGNQVHNCLVLNSHNISKNIFKMLDARPGFIIKFLKRSLIVNLFKTQAFDCQSAVFDR